MTLDGVLECWGNSDKNQSSPPGGQFIQVTSQRGYSCGIRASGVLECWGDVPAALEWARPYRTASSVSTGGSGACALTSSGGLVCWPLRESDGQFDPWEWPWRLTGDRFKQVSVGIFDGCGVRESGKVECWARSSLSPLRPLDGSFVQVTVDAGRACGLRSSGELACWNREGEETDVARDLAGRFVQVDLLSHAGACGLRPTGTIECTPWTGGAFPFAPTRGAFVALSTGGQGVCGLTERGTIECAEFRTNVDVSSLESVSEPPGTFESVSVGYHHACAVRSDSALVAGTSLMMLGKFGRIIVTSQSMSPGDQYAAQTCATRTDGSVECWRWNSPGKAPAGRFTQLSADGGLHCGVRDDNRMICWGWVEVYENPGGYPYRGSGLPGRFSLVSADEWSTCGLSEDGSIECGLAEPIEGQFVAVSSRNEHWCGIRNSGEVQCGSNGDVYLGLGGAHSLPSPIGKVKHIDVAWSYACGLRQEDTIHCWPLVDHHRSRTESAVATETILSQIPLGRFVQLSTTSDHALRHRSGWRTQMLGFERA